MSIHRYLSLAAFVLLFTSTNAQVSIGHHAGLSWSKWARHFPSPGSEKDFAHEQTWSQGWTLGIPVTWAITPHFSLCTGVDWMQKGYSVDTERGRLNYVQVPLRAGFPIHAGRLTVRPELGAVYSWFTGGADRFHNDPAHPSAYVTLPLGPAGDKSYPYRMARTEVALSLGAQLSYPWQQAELTLQVGAQLGLSDLMSDYDFSSAGSAYNSNFYVQLGYAIPLGRKPSTDTTAARTDTIAPPKPDRRRFRIGQRFGGTSSWLFFDASLPSEVQRVEQGALQLQGITTAVMAQIPLSDRWSLRPELAYTQKGWSCRWYPRPTYDNDLLRFNYVELPVLLEYAAKGHGRVRPFVFGGPTLAMGVGGIDRYTIPPFTGTTTPVTESVTFGTDAKRGDFARWDVSATLGVGITAGAFLFDVRYAHGLMDIYQEGQPDLYSKEATVRHRMIALSVGYLLPWQR